MAQLWAIQNPKKSPFSHHDLVWRDVVRNGKGKFLTCKETRIPTSRIEDFLLGERLLEDGVEWDIQKTLKGQPDSHPNPRITMHRGHR